MPPKVQQQTKAQKAAAAMAGGKSRKKKWSTKKVGDSAQHATTVSPELKDRIWKDASAFKLVTVSVLVDRLKINGSVARRALRALEEEGIIKPVITHSTQKTYTRASA